jgi:pyruvate/2-oxoglutarate/acetoin dehydrogenase E1 component
MKYFNELKRSMEYLSKKKNTIFIGQAVKVAGTVMSNTLINVKKNKKIEMPVAEEMQMGITIGLMMTGYVPISIFPRWNFLLLAMNQLVNHLDKFNIMTNSKFYSKAIIRTGIGSQRPLHPQCQHLGDFTNEVAKMCPNINVVKLDNPKKIFTEYKKAFNANNNRSTILVEYGDYYNEK